MAVPPGLLPRLLLELHLGVLLGLLATPGPPLVSWSTPTEGMLEEILLYSVSAFCNIFTHAAMAASALLAEL